MLREHGFSDQNIHVLYGGGEDFDRCNSIELFDREITDKPVSTKEQIENEFKILGEKIEGRDDLLYVWWTGHAVGGGTDTCNLSLEISTSPTGEGVSDQDLCSYIFDNIHDYGKIILAVETCNSGGVIDNMYTVGNRTVTFAASTCEQNSYTTESTCDDVPHARFNYVLTNALRQKECDSVIESEDPLDGDDYVSLLEAYHYITEEMQGSTLQTPQMGDPDILATETNLEEDAP